MSRLEDDQRQAQIESDVAKRKIGSLEQDLHLASLSKEGWEVRCYPGLLCEGIFQIEITS